jgi:hypothetical protein
LYFINLNLLLKGLRLSEDQINCETFDLCNDGNNGGCEQTCHHDQSIVKCLCLKGFDIDARDITRCVDVNECETDENICGNLECQNTYGSFECKCHEGDDEPDENGNCKDANLSCKNNGGCSQLSRLVLITWGL